MTGAPLVYKVGDMIPDNIQGAIDRYVNDRIPPGDCVEAILSNDLCEAFARADRETIAAMFSIVSYLYNHVPRRCWGSREVVAEWLK